MGASTDQIDRQIKETRERMDENIGTLEERAAANAMRYGRIAAIVVAAVLAAGGAIFVYRRLRKPTFKDRLRSVSPRALRGRARELGSRLRRVRKEMPTVTLTVTDADEPGTVERIVRKVTPALIGTASTAVIEKVSGRGSREDTEPDEA